MLDIFRKRGFASFIYTGLMAAVLVVFIIQFRPGANSPLAGLSRNCVAKVRGTCVDEKDWRAQRYLIRGPYEGGPTINYNKAAMDSLIERTLLEQEAERVGVRVTNDDVMRELIRYKVYVHIPVSMRAQGRQLGINELGFRWTQFSATPKEKPFDQQFFEKIVRQTTGQNPDEFADSQQHELLAARYLELVAERVRVSDAEAWDQYVSEKNTSTIRYARFNGAYFSQFFVPLDQASIDKWAAGNPEMLEAKEKAAKEEDKHLYHPRHILVDVKKDAKPEEKAAARKRADDLLAKVKGGADFGALAKDESSDPGSKDKGGEYDWTSGQEYVPEFREGLAKLKVGETAIVETQYGFHVLQLMGKLDGRAAIAFPLYRSFRGEELAREAVQKYADALKGKLPVDASDPAIKAKVDDAKKAGKSDADALNQALDDAAHTRMAKALDDVMASFAPSAPPAKAPENKPAPAAPDGKAATPTPPPAPAWQLDEHKPRVEDSTAFNASGSPIIGLMDQQTITDAAAKLTRESPLAGPLKASGDYFVIALQERHEATKPEFDKDRATFVGQMVARKREDAVVNYVTALREGVSSKELTVEARYTADDKAQKGQGQGPDQPPPPPPDEDQP